MKASIALALTLIPALVIASLLAYWVYIWTYQGVSLPPFKPLLLRLTVSNGSVVSVNGNATIVISKGSAINASLTITYPYPWQLMHQTPYYYYYYGPYYSTQYYYYYSGRWYPSYQAYYYGYYYAFQAPQSITFTYLLAVRSYSGGKGVNVVKLLSNSVTIPMGGSYTVRLTNYVLSNSGNYDVAGFAWTGMIDRVSNSWASLANPVSCSVTVR